MRLVQFDWEDDDGREFVNVYAIPDDAPEDLTEGEADTLAVAHTTVGPVIIATIVTDD